MRDITFRGKRKDTGEWVHGFFANAKWYIDEKQMAIIFPADICMFPHCEVSGWEEVIPETVGQFTGLLDKNGKKIFEGDILLVNDIQKAYVFFEKGQFVVNHFAINVLCSRNIESVVIGNIHDNPELLGV